MSVYRVIEIVGSSERGWEDAAKQAIGAAAKSLNGLRVATVVDRDLALDGHGRIEAYRIKMELSFKYDDFAAEAALAREIVGW